MREILVVTIAAASLCAGLASASDEACTVPDLLDLASTDVAIIVDRSLSVTGPSGADIDGDGQVGEIRNSQLTDPDDTLMAAEIAAVRSFIKETDALDLQIALIGFSSTTQTNEIQPSTRIVRDREANVEAELGSDFETLNSALDHLSRRKVFGYSNFSAAMRLAIQTLRRSNQARPDARRLVLFISDSTTPITVAVVRTIDRSDPLMRVAAVKAIDAKIIFHTFAIGDAAHAPAPHPLSQIAGATGGRYRIVTDPTELGCHLQSALAQ